MGNCCGSGDAESQTASGKKPPAFQGSGHRLGTGDETRYSDTAPAPTTIQRNENDIPEPVLDKNLSEAQRAQIRLDRAKAAEARIKKQGGAVKPKKKQPSNAPLKGPNSEPLMRWN